MSELTKALAAAQGEFPLIPKNREVNAGPRRYKYAELATILAAVTPALVKHGLAVTQRMDVTEHGTVLITDLRHAAGEVVSSCLPLQMEGLQPQALGSLLTYLKRYSLTSLLNVAADEDDDAQIAQDEPKSSHQRQTRQPPKPQIVHGEAPEAAVERANARADERDPWKLSAAAADQRVDLMLIAIESRPWPEVEKAMAAYRELVKLNLTDAERKAVTDAYKARRDAVREQMLPMAG